MGTCLLDRGDFLSDTFYNLDLIITELTGADCKCAASTLEMKHKLGRFDGEPSAKHLADGFKKVPDMGQLRAHGPG